MAWKVLFFQTARGNYPVKEFIQGLDKTIYTRVIHAIELLETDAPFLKPPYIKKLRDKLYELRISGTVAVRIFYTVVQSKYHLLHAFKKKSQKTPTKEIKIAIDRMRELI